MSRAHEYVLVHDALKSAPMGFSEASRVLAALYEEGHDHAKALVNGKPATRRQAKRLADRAYAILEEKWDAAEADSAA